MFGLWLLLLVDEEGLLIWKETGLAEGGRKPEELMEDVLWYPFRLLSPGLEMVVMIAGGAALTTFGLLAGRGGSSSSLNVRSTTSDLRFCPALGGAVAAGVATDGSLDGIEGVTNEAGVAGASVLMPFSRDLGSTISMKSSSSSLSS